MYMKFYIILILIEYASQSNKIDDLSFDDLISIFDGYRGEVIILWFFVWIILVYI